MGLVGLSSLMPKDTGMVAFIAFMERENIMGAENKKRRLDDELQSKTELLHELHVHKIESEMQNQQFRESQQKLEEARDRYADLYDYAPVGYLTLDEKGVVLEINLTGATILCNERLNIVGQPFISLLSASSIQPFLTHLRQTFSLPGNSVAEIKIKSKDGKFHNISLESLAIAGEKRTCRTVMTDITEQRRLAVALQVNRSAQEALLGTIPALVFYLDNNHHFLNVSEAYADFLGRSPGDIRGKTIYDLFPRVVAEEIEHICNSVLQTGTSLYGFENNVPDKNGTLVCLSTLLAPYRDTKGKTIGLVGVSIDISTIKSVAISNSELLIQNRKLTRSLFAAHEEERRYLARELHDELGQWLTAIEAEAQAICNISRHTPKILESALAISKSTQSVYQVIRGMMRQLRPNLLDELGLADSLLEFHKQWCRRHPGIICELNHGVALDGLGEEINVTVYRLVQEALNNVAKHSHARRVAVSLKLESGEDGAADYLLLKVDDDGSGFDIRQTCAGIGLLGMRERVIAVGGDFYIETAPGRGTNILAKLPLKQ